MKVENIQKVMMSLEISDTYDQKDWKHDCGTPACIYGHATALAINTNDLSHLSNAEIEDIGRQYMGLDALTSLDLTRSFPYGQSIDLDPIQEPTNRQAIQVLDHLIHKGKVDWKRFKRE